MNELIRTRAKILGLMIKDARLYAGRTVADCAAVVQMSPEDFERVEKGDGRISLPDLEVLAMYLGVPLSHFWGDRVINKPHQSDYRELMKLRHQIIGGQLRRARIEANRTVEEVAAQINVEPAVVAAYEAGERPIPLFELERMGKYLGVSLDYFMDRQHGPLAEHEARQKLQQQFEALPEEIKAFVVEPRNQGYLETALNLSQMDVERLRRIAEGLLDITF